MTTHPIVLITTIGRVQGRPIDGVAPFATCLDTSYDPPYVTFSVCVRQHSVVGESPNHGKMNTESNLRQVPYFIINIPGRELLPRLDTLSYPYSRKLYEDKIKLADLTKLEPTAIPSKKMHPKLIAECLAHLECKVVDMHRPSGSDHYNVTGKVLAVCYDDCLGNNLDTIRVNLVSRVFHHFGSASDHSARLLGYIQIDRLPEARIFALEKTKY